nr:MAG TPA: hypothetical protein [Caudoviricetes sp.]
MTVLQNLCKLLLPTRLFINSPSNVARNDLILLK